MTPLDHYMQDGANKQARATLCFLQGMTIEESWNKERSQYDAEIRVARWENCREQGYVVMLRRPDSKTLNIAFFEHRNSDNICAIRWEQSAYPNSPNIDTAQFGDQCYKDKYDVSHSLGYGKAFEMAEWISAALIDFWMASKAKEAKA